MVMLMLMLVLDCAYVDAHGARFSGFLCFVFVLPCAYVYVAIVGTRLKGRTIRFFFGGGGRQIPKKIRADL